MQKPYRTVEFDPVAKNELRPTLFDELQRDRIGVFAIGARHVDRTIGAERFSLFGRHALEHPVFSEIRRRRDADQAANSLTQPASDPQHDPTAHARTDQHQRSGRHLRYCFDRVLGPQADGAVFKPTRRLAVPPIVEAQIPVAEPFADVVEIPSLGAGHVRSVSTQENHRRCSAAEMTVRDRAAIGA